MESRHISVWINRPATDVYRYAADPANLKKWAAGVTEDMAVEFAPANDFGVLDHTVTLPTGDRFHNPLRVLAAGESLSEIVFTLRRAPETSDADFEKDATAVAADLTALKRILEQH